MSENRTAASHWERVYQTRSASDVSWYQPSADLSLELIGRAGIECAAPIVDVGAGASTLVDGLLDRGYTDLSLLDVAPTAFAATRARLGARAEQPQYIVADITHWEPSRIYAMWHDRAVFHFLTDEAQRLAYRRALRVALAPGGRALVATFADDGPERCSGLPVRRYSPEALAAEFVDVLRPMEARRAIHRTPAGGSQSFVFVLFERT